MQSPAKETRARHRTCSILNLHPSLVISIRFSYSLVHCALQLAAPLLVRENASAQRLKSQQLVRSRFQPFLLLVRKARRPPTPRGCLLLDSISKGKGLMHCCLLHSLSLNDEAKSGRRDLNPQPQPWQGYALPLSYFRQLR